MMQDVYIKWILKTMRQVDIVIHNMDTSEEGKETSLSTLFLTNKFVGLYT